MDRQRSSPVVRHTGRVGVLAAFCLAARGSNASAQDAASLATRRVLIERAQAARTGNDHAAALDLAQRAAQIAMTPSLRLFIAQEQNALGRLAEAFGNADLCMREAERDESVRNRGVVAATCRALASALHD